MILILFFSALKDLQGRVFCENWSISYREGEALHKCLTAAMRLAQIDTCEEDKDCNKFISDVSKGFEGLKIVPLNQLNGLFKPI